MEYIYDWEEQDRFSFEDSDRFEEDSLCSWVSEAESVSNNNWRGWRKGGTTGGGGSTQSSHSNEVIQLVELAAKTVALHFPFEVVERMYPPVPENLQLRIAFWSFPENEEDVRLYSCLANGSPDEYQKGEHMVKSKAVKDALQIGFHLSGTVVPSQGMTQQGTFNVAITFDRRRISSCSCTCSSASKWCSHVVALCLYRIIHSTQVCLRAPVSESLSRLHRDQLQKFSQYLISELPRQILPTAQRLLDELLSSQANTINMVCGAPDPTAGPSASEQTRWFLDDAVMHENIKKTLIRFTGPTPIVFSDVTSLYLSSSAPQAAAEWTNLLRPLRGREPEGIWNLLSIVREMCRRRDSNAVNLLKIMTEECILCDQIVIWWFSTGTSALHSHHGNHGHRANSNSTTAVAQHACASMCDEIVFLWRLVALNPAITPPERGELQDELRKWHLQVIDKVRKGRGPNFANTVGNVTNVRRVDIEVFTGFKPAIGACLMDWKDYQIEGVTYTDPKANRDEAMKYRASKRTPPHTQQNKPSQSGPPITTEEAACPTVAEVDSKSSREPQKGSSNELHRLSSSESIVSSSSSGVDDQRVLSSSRSEDTDSDFQAIDCTCPKEIGAEGGATRTSKLCAVHHPSAHLETQSRDAKPGGKRKVKVKHLQHNESVDSAEVSLETPPKGQLPDSDSSLEAGSHGNQQVKGDVDEARHSGDEYQVYFYDTKAKLSEQTPKKKSDAPNPFSRIKRMEDKIEIMFSRAEALHAHGYTRNACKLAIELAEEMLDNPPELNNPPPSNLSNRARKKHVHLQSTLATMTLAKASFLCSVLSEQPDCHHLAFKIGMFGLELPRQPASTKALEVKLANQESELVGQLKRLPLTLTELTTIRQLAQHLHEGTLVLRSAALLASFIFDALSLPGQTSSLSRSHNRCVSSRDRLPTDETCGFDAAVAALAVKINVSESEHPLLCEGIRRQKGELSTTLLVHYKDDQSKLRKILDALLDKQGPRTQRSSQPVPTPSPRPSQHDGSHRNASSSMVEEDNSNRRSHQSRSPQDEGSGERAPEVSHHGPEAATCNVNPDPNAPPPPRNSAPSQDTPSIASCIQHLNSRKSLSPDRSNAPAAASSRVMSSPSQPPRPPSDVVATGWNEDPAACSGMISVGPDIDQWRQAQTRASGSGSGRSSSYMYWGRIFGKNQKRSKGMAAIDSSAPETTSSDNSPTMGRRVPLGGWGRYHGPGSDSGSSGNSSDSISSSSSAERGSGARPKIRDAEGPVPASPWLPPGPSSTSDTQGADSRSSTPNSKGVRKGGKKGGRSDISPSIPNQPSEASAHFFFELARTVLTKAGGSSSTSLFTQPAANTNHTGPHRGLHLCAFEIGLYALWLHNAVTPNWLSRTYSSHVSWITGQAMEIGSAAIGMLVDTWEGHLTPTEAASLADKASRGLDPNMVGAAAELALSCLRHAHALNPTEVNRALTQCKEQDYHMLANACLAVESAAKGGDVYPDVLFNVARQWEWLHDNMWGAANNTRRTRPSEGADAHPPAGRNGSPTTESSQIVPYSVAVTVAPNAAMVSPMLLPYGVARVPQAVPLVYHPGCPEYVQVDPSYLPRGVQASFPVYPAPPRGNNGLQGRHPQAGHRQLPPNSHNIHWNAVHQCPPYYSTCPYSSANPPPQGVPLPIPNQFPPQAPPGGQPGVPIRGPHGVYPLPSMHPRQPPSSQPSPPQQNPPLQQVVGPMGPHPHTGLFYLDAAYRVGMLAIDTLARRVHDERTQSRFSPNPPYGEDIKWLLEISKRLGSSYLQQFCACVLNVVVSPFVLHTIAWESAHYLASNNHTPIQANLRSLVLSPIVQKCVQMYIQCIHQRMYHVTQPEYDDFINVVQSAQKAFVMAPGGMAQFNDFLQSLRRLSPLKRELWTRLASTLSPGNVFEHSSSSH
ncbi:zinc finger SWIM domain-containing protein 8-like [Asterias rubens]|uniref:zinc finger SWIM domain-containing protein 8-like n=1 Tax=Asterias rubens TaxID=7604 RepID=UPI0014550ED3|nr:zinc finger SWIM domain-containing protein 8-like [Asterias rubens]